ncbi:MAG: S1 RNA-binding domain-containing protein [Anaerolineae bacterium]|nr:S1 RNA-binding domain-containing protein [Anaerolineae bacterium]
MERRSLRTMASFIRRVSALIAEPSPGGPPQEAEKATSPEQQSEDVLAATPATPVAAPEAEQAARWNAHDEAPQDSAAHEADWRLAEELLATGETQEATVVGWNRGGLLVHWRNLQGFLPASQLQRMIRYSTDAERDAAFAGRVGEALYLKVIEVDRSRKRLVFSERAAQWGTRNGQCLWQELVPGQVRRGRVRNLCDFGAFIDLGGIDGLVHISELAWRHVRHPSESLQIGQEVDVLVMSVEPERKRVALSLKKLTRDPWESVQERYRIGQVVQGIVTNVLSFGAFARIEDGVEGLIHISELAEGNLPHPRDVIAEGDRVTVRVISIDPANRRLGLSLRQTHASGGGQVEELLATDQ